MKKRWIALTLGLTLALGTSMTSLAATAQDVINMNQTSYTAGTNSVYGAKLSQDQLNAVAQAVADFKTNYVNDSMDNDAKIRAGYDYIKNNVSYIDWRESDFANTAYGALVEKKAACSGMTRAFVALMDAVGVKAYWIHATDNSHQWNMVEFNDGFYFIDIDANIASGAEIFYHVGTHPYAYDTASYPAIGSKSGTNTSGTTNTTTESWKQDNIGWWYQNADGSYPTNTWKEISGAWYYFEGNGYMAANKWIGNYYVGSNGAMLTNTTTPDGYQVGTDGAWIQGQGQTQNDGVHIVRASDAYNVNLQIDAGPENYKAEMHAGTMINVIEPSQNTFRFSSNGSNLDAKDHTVSIWAVSEIGDYVFALGKDGDPYIMDYKFEYDKDFSLDFTGQNRTAQEFSKYCKDNNVLIKIEIKDDLNPNQTIGPVFYLCYATENSIRK